jgi:hypothetical protein
MADIKIPAIKPPSAPWAISFGEFMSNAQAIITPDKTPTNAKIIHINKAQPLFLPIRLLTIGNTKKHWF